MSGLIDNDGLRALADHHRAEVLDGPPAPDPANPFEYGHTMAGQARELAAAGYQREAQWVAGLARALMADIPPDTLRDPADVRRDLVGIVAEAEADIERGPGLVSTVALRRILGWPER